MNPLFSFLGAFFIYLLSEQSPLRLMTDMGDPTSEWLARVEVARREHLGVGGLQPPKTSLNPSKLQFQSAEITLPARLQIAVVRH